MLEDHKRTGAYYNAVLENKRLFKDKVVLDVGTGSGILAIFSALAGAKKVYAVEATDMAKNARKLVEHNKVRASQLCCYVCLPQSSPAHLRHPQRVPPSKCSSASPPSQAVQAEAHCGDVPWQLTVACTLTSILLPASCCVRPVPCCRLLLSAVTYTRSWTTLLR